MAKSGKRYPLVIYKFMMKRWAPAVFTLGLAMLGLTFMLRNQLEEWRWIAFGSFGGFVTCVGLILWLIQNSAYIQLQKDFLKLATPFLRLNISYKRIRRASSAHMGSLFPPNSIRKSEIDIIEPLSKMTAIVIELNALPMPQSSLRFFLSRFFFKDTTPHLVILVDDWMRFSAELESKRVGEVTSAPQAKRDISILSKLPKK
jgi:hypothetical protein